MRIVMIAKHPCIRIVKQALPLIFRGHEVHLIAEAVPQYGEYFTSVGLYTNLEQLHELIRGSRGADIYHCHNEPSWFVICVKDVLGDVPTILDVHDAMLTRNDTVLTDERVNFRLADGLIFSSEATAKLMVGALELTQPTMTLFSMCPESWYRIDSGAWRGGIVYEGRVDLPQDIEEGLIPEYFKYADFTELAVCLRNLKIPFCLYNTENSKEATKHYHGLAICRNPLVLHDLIPQLSNYEWGITGNIIKHKIYQYALSNKVFEYIAAGLPVLALKAPYAGKFVEDNGLGISIETIQELGDIKERYHEIRKQVILNRMNWTMENHIQRLETFYKEVKGN